MNFLQWWSLTLSLCVIHQLLLRIIQMLFSSSTTKKNHLFKTSSMVRRMCLWEKITVYDALGRVRKKVLWLQANQTQNSLRHSSYTSISILVDRCVNFFPFVVCLIPTENFIFHNGPLTPILKTCKWVQVSQGLSVQRSIFSQQEK